MSVKVPPASALDAGADRPAVPVAAPAVGADAAFPAPSRDSRGVRPLRIVLPDTGWNSSLASSILGPSYVRSRRCAAARTPSLGVTLQTHGATTAGDAATTSRGAACAGRALHCCDRCGSCFIVSAQRGAARGAADGALGDCIHQSLQLRVAAAERPGAWSPHHGHGIKLWCVVVRASVAVCRVSGVGTAVVPASAPQEAVPSSPSRSRRC
jgi:hypothetical protein